MSFDPVAFIAERRDGRVHPAEEIRAFIDAVTARTVADYQASSWLMAAYLNPLTPSETAELTLAMARSGERIDLEGLPRPWLDKHSTGGVGDKTTLVLLPLLAACGLTMVKMSGKGLGITGGTVDKLASIEGFRTDLSPAEMKEQAARIGLALTGQTPRLAPADGVLYGLRDVTATVGSLPLIVSSILSKKIAGGADSVVLDVKCGAGALMRTLPEAQELARALTEVGTHAGLRVRAVITDMAEPLGGSAGNALEVREAVRVLRGDRPNPAEARFRELVLRFAAEGLALARGVEPIEATAQVTEALENGAAALKASEWFLAQGALFDPLESPDRLPVAPVQVPVVAPMDGWVSRWDAGAVGQAALDLGAGRKTKDAPVDPAVGVTWTHPVGARVAAGEVVAVLHARTGEEAEESARKILAGGLEILPDPPAAPPLFLS